MLALLHQASDNYFVKCTISNFFFFLKPLHTIGKVSLNTSNDKNVVSQFLNPLSKLFQSLIFARVHLPTPPSPATPSSINPNCVHLSVEGNDWNYNGGNKSLQWMGRLNLRRSILILLTLFVNKLGYTAATKDEISLASGPVVVPTKIHRAPVNWKLLHQLGIEIYGTIVRLNLLFLIVLHLFVACRLQDAAKTVLEAVLTVWKWSRFKWK